MNTSETIISANICVQVTPKDEHGKYQEGRQEHAKTRRYNYC